MPIEIIYLLILPAVILTVFAGLKRPIYEAMLAGYIVLIAVSGQWANIFTYLVQTSTNTLFYAIVAFLAAAQIFSFTRVMDKAIAIILALFGRRRGGAGYAALAASTFMGALSGSGAGNVAATGVFSIPAMKRSGFPAHLAANVEMSASTLGNMIPPAGVITASFGVLAAFAPGYSMGRFWLVVWGIALWFILQRLITLYIFCRVFKVKPMPAGEIPSLGPALRAGWPSLMLAVIIFLPFLLDVSLKQNLFARRLGSGADSLSASVLLFTPGLAAMYALWVARKQSGMGLSASARALSRHAAGIVPVSATIFFAYAISKLFISLDVGASLRDFIISWGLSYRALALLVPLFCAILGMIMPGSSQVAIFGSALVSVLVAAGGHPVLMAAILPAITGAMEGMTPPLALCMYTAMGIAQSPFKQTAKTAILWISLHYIMSVLVILGILPILGL